MTNTRTIEVDGRKSINALVFLEDGKHLLSGGEDGMIRQWRVEDGKEIDNQRLWTGNAIRAIALSSDGNWIVSVGWPVPVITVWNRRTRQIARRMGEHTHWVNAVDVSPDSTMVVAGTDDGKAFIWDISSGQQIRTGLPHDSAVASVRFSPDGSRVAVAVWLRALHIYNAQTSQLIRSIDAEVYRSNSIAWSSNSQHIFALASGNVLKHIDVNQATTQFLAEWKIPGEPGGNWSTIALPGSGRFIAAFVGLSLTFWDTSTRMQLGPVFDHPHVPRLRSMALSLDNTCIATASENGIINLHNLKDTIPMTYLVDRSASQPQNGCRADLQPQIGALRDILHALEQHCDMSNDTQVVHPQRVPSGTYRIKSNMGDLYLTGPQAGAATVVVQPLDSSSAFQKWTVSHVADGAYDIVNNSELSLTVGVGAPLLAGQKGTTWTFDPRGVAFVIGNAANVMAIQFEPNPRSVTVLPRNVGATD